MDFKAMKKMKITIGHQAIECEASAEVSLDTQDVSNGLRSFTVGPESFVGIAKESEKYAEKMKSDFINEIAAVMEKYFDLQPGVYQIEFEIK